MIRASKPADEKVKAAADLEEILQRSRSILLTDFTGLTVQQFDRLRLLCFKNDITFRVAKNTLAKLVMNRNNVEGLDELLEGPTGFCFGFDDPILPVKLMMDFIKVNDKPVIKGALVEGRLYRDAEIDFLKSIPPREVLLGLIVGSIASPLSGFVTLLNEILRSFVSVIDAIGTQAEGAPEDREGLTSTGGTVQNIVEAIEKMTVLELVELKKALEEKFGVSAAAPMMMAPGLMPAAAGEAAAETVEQTEFTVLLTSGGDKKIQVIKEVRAITSLGLKEAKALVDEAPKPIKEGITKDEAMAIKAKIEEAGGQVELK